MTAVSAYQVISLDILEKYLDDFSVFANILL